jgi:hypothetical protein
MADELKTVVDARLREARLALEILAGEVTLLAVDHPEDAALHSRMLVRIATVHRVLNDEATND